MQYSAIKARGFMDNIYAHIHTHTNSAIAARGTMHDIYIYTHYI